MLIEPTSCQMILDGLSSNTIFLKGNTRRVSCPALSPVLEANEGMILPQLTNAPVHSY